MNRWINSKQTVGGGQGRGGRRTHTETRRKFPKNKKNRKECTQSRRSIYSVTELIQGDKARERAKEKTVNKHGGGLGPTLPIKPECGMRCEAPGGLAVTLIHFHTHQRLPWQDPAFPGCQNEE